MRTVLVFLLAAHVVPSRSLHTQLISLLEIVLFLYGQVFHVSVGLARGAAFLVIGVLGVRRSGYRVLLLLEIFQRVVFLSRSNNLRAMGLVTMSFSVIALDWTVLKALVDYF